jgi:hypothetical protein
MSHQQNPAAPQQQPKTPATPANPVAPVPLDASLLRHVVGGTASAPNKGW